jgi:predicted metal-dependent hydrolase
MAGTEARPTGTQALMTDLYDHDIEYRISPRRKSIGIQVTAAGNVVVTMPRGTSKANLARALEKHRAWIATKVAERKAAWGRIREGEAYFLGQAYRLTARPGSRGAVALDGDEIQVTLPTGGAGLWFHLCTWYAEHAYRLIQERVSHFEGRMGLTAGPVELKEWRRRWGECHPDGKLRFNWRLIMCPSEIIDYVVVHELAHLKVPGHNPGFWGQVAAVLPDYARRRQWLNREGAPFLLWRPELEGGRK